MHDTDTIVSYYEPSLGVNMKAVLFHQHGGPEVLEYADFLTPEPGPGEVLVRLEAAALNRLDLWVREGWPGIKLEYPHIPGADGAGVIAALPPDIGGAGGGWVENWRPRGDQLQHGLRRV